MKLNRFLLLAAVAKAQDAPAASSQLVDSQDFYIPLKEALQGMTPEQIQAIMESK